MVRTGTGTRTPPGASAQAWPSGTLRSGTVASWRGSWPRPGSARPAGHRGWTPAGRRSAGRRTGSAGPRSRRAGGSAPRAGGSTIARSVSRAPSRQLAADRDAAALLAMVNGRRWSWRAPGSWPPSAPHAASARHGWPRRSGSAASAAPRCCARPGRSREHGGDRGGRGAAAGEVLRHLRGPAARGGHAVRRVRGDHRPDPGGGTRAAGGAGEAGRARRGLGPGSSLGSRAARTRSTPPRRRSERTPRTPPISPRSTTTPRNCSARCRPATPP